MKTESNSRVLRTIPLLWCLKALLLASPFVFFGGCLEFKSIEQPATVLQGEMFTVLVETTVEPIRRRGFDEGEHPEPYLGICLPLGWTIPGDAIPCTGVYDATIVYDSNLALEQESLSPAPDGYYWWVGYGDAAETEEGSVFSVIQIQTDEQTGTFSIDYMLGNSGDGLNQQRSNGHLVEVIVEVIVDVHAPTGLQAVVEGESVFLSWSAPHTSEGLIGYIVYRDGEVINSNFVVDATYVDDNPGAGIHNYTIASFYNEGNVYFAPDILEVFVCAGGTGEPGDPFRIATAKQLTAIGSHPSLLDRHYILISDIDLDPDLPGRQIFDRAVIAPDSSDMDEGFQGSAFTGTFDGNRHTVSNLKIMGDSYLGLFGALGPEAQIIDVNVVNVDVTGNGWNIGAITGTNGGTVQECYCSGLVMGYSDVGGLVGSNNSAYIINSSSDTDVVGIEFVGGLAGSQLALANVYGSNAKGSVFGWHWVGGLIGFNQGTVSKCSSSSSINGSSFLGGLVGYNHITGLISNCYSCSTVRGEDTLGGLIGGNMGSIRYTYSAGEVVGVSHIGGLVGMSDAPAEVVASFWDMEVSGQSSSEGGIGLTTAELQQVNTYVDAGWDFAAESENGTENVWYLTSDGPAQFFYFEGMGTSEDPYLVDTVWHLTSIGSDPNMLDKHFKLTTHIDLDPNQLGSRVFTEAIIAPDVSPYNDSYDGVPFTGEFDGCGYEIRNMRIIGLHHLGLFGWIGPEAHVSNLSVVGAYVNVEDIRDDRDRPRAISQGLLAGTNAGEVDMCHTSGSTSGCGEQIGGLIGDNLGNVSRCTSSVGVQGVQAVGGLIGNHYEGQVTDCYSTGTVWQLEQLNRFADDYVGGLIGLNYAYVGRCYATGDVHGTGDWIGGLVGDNRGTIEQCYSIGVVTGHNYVGGLVGGNRDREGEGEISECYSIGAVTGNVHVGGLVGWNDWIVTHSFWDIETSGQSSSEGGIGLTTAQMQDIGIYLNTGWDFFGREFDGNEDTWVMETYPVLYTSQLPGKGTVESPYLISEQNKLIAFRNLHPSAHYRMTEDIDMSEIQWETSLLDEYFGTFDGGGFSLRNLTIVGEDVCGLFGTLRPDATVKNLTIENVFVEGGTRAIGSLVGYNYGFVTHCECTGVVTGSWYHVGGLVGKNMNRGYVSNCSSTATVTGHSTVGGIAGSNSKSGHISNCSSTATVTGYRRVGGIVGSSNGAVVGCHSNATVSGGDSQVGGIAGENNGDVTNCYNTGSVSGERGVGGLVGGNDGSIAMSYSTSAVTGSDYVGGLVGSNHSENAVITASYWDVQTSGRTNMCGLQEEGATGCDDSFGLATAEMQTAATFLEAGWDFISETANGTEDIWWIDEGQSYPRLWWETSN